MSHKGFEAFIRIEEGEVMREHLLRKAARIVLQSALDHQRELMANWQPGVDLLPIDLIAGADSND